MSNGHAMYIPYLCLRRVAISMRHRSWYLGTCTKLGSIIFASQIFQFSLRILPVGLYLEPHGCFDHFLLFLSIDLFCALSKIWLLVDSYNLSFESKYKPRDRNRIPSKNKKGVSVTFLSCHLLKQVIWTISIYVI